MEILQASNSLYKILTLMYHRIDVIDTNPWGVCVSPKNFEEQVKFLKNNFNIISSNDLIDEIKEGNVTNNSICITFDDGYADNYFHAKTILEKYNCPATFFIPTTFINQPTCFWWDALELILLHSKKLPHSLSLKIAGENYNYTLDKNELTQQQFLLHANWKWHEEPPTKRCAVFLNIWEKLRPLAYEEINKQINVLREWGCIDDSYDTFRLPMNEEQLLELSKNKLFNIAMHTHTHPDLQDKEKQFQHQEILLCKRVLSNKYGIESNYLAYPYGRFDDNTIKVINELKIEACFTTEAVNINKNTNLNMLGRYQVFDWNTEKFKQQLNKWLYIIK